jgi:hypothetical protein
MANTCLPDAVVLDQLVGAGLRNFDGLTMDRLSGTVRSDGVRMTDRSGRC